MTKKSTLKIVTDNATQHNLNLNTAVGLDMKMIVQTPPTTTTETQHQPSGAPDDYLLTTT